jgi:hypothetical protein
MCDPSMNELCATKTKRDLWIDPIYVDHSSFIEGLHMTKNMASGVFQTLCREYKRGKYLCTTDLLFDWFGLVCFANKNKKLSVFIQLIPNQSNRRSMVQWYFTLYYSLPYVTHSLTRESLLKGKDQNDRPLYTSKFWILLFILKIIYNKLS